MSNLTGQQIEDIAELYNIAHYLSHAAGEQDRETAWAHYQSRHERLMKSFESATECGKCPEWQREGETVKGLCPAGNFWTTEGTLCQRESK